MARQVTDLGRGERNQPAERIPAHTGARRIENYQVGAPLGEPAKEFRHRHADGAKVSQAVGAGICGEVRDGSGFPFDGDNALEPASQRQGK